MQLNVLDDLAEAMKALDGKKGVSDDLPPAESTALLQRPQPPSRRSTLPSAAAYALPMSASMQRESPRTDTGAALTHVIGATGQHDPPEENHATSQNKGPQTSSHTCISDQIDLNLSSHHGISNPCVQMCHDLLDKTLKNHNMT